MNKKHLVLFLLSFSTFIHAQSHFERGEKLLKNDKFQESIKWFEKSLEVGDKVCESIKLLGIAHSELDNFEIAYNKLNLSIECDSSDFETYSYLGIVSAYLGDYTSAIGSFKKSIDLNSEDVYNYIQSGLCRIELNDYSGARDDLINGIAHDSLNSEAFGVLGLVLVKLGDLELAIESYQKSVSIEPNGKNLASLGEAYDLSDNYLEALKFYSKSLNLDDCPKNAVLFARGSLYLRNGESEKACIDFKQSAQLGNLSAKAELDYCK